MIWIEETLMVSMDNQQEEKRFDEMKKVLIIQSR